MSGLFTSKKTDDSSQTSQIKTGAPSALENLGGQDVQSGLQQLAQMINAGPGQGAITDANSANDSLGAMLQKFSQGGFTPDASQNATAQQFAASQYAPQQQALDVSYRGAKQDAARLAAQMNRPVNDPIIQAKLMQQHMDQQGQLSSQQGAFATNYAMQMPQQQLGFAQQLASLKSGLASQAMANRQALMGLGSQVQGAERNWSLQTGVQTGKSSSTQTSTASPFQSLLQAGSAIGGIASGIGSLGSMFSGAGGAAGATASGMGVGPTAGGMMAGAQTAPATIAAAQTGFSNPFNMNWQGPSSSAMQGVSYPAPSSVAKAGPFSSGGGGFFSLGG